MFNNFTLVGFRHFYVNFHVYYRVTVPFIALTQAILCAYRRPRAQSVGATEANSCLGTDPFKYIYMHIYM